MGRLFFVSILLLLCPALGCLGFDDYPEGDLCEDAPRDDQGRAVSYPEWRICEPVNLGGHAGAGGAGE